MSTIRDRVSPGRRSAFQNGPLRRAFATVGALLLLPLLLLAPVDAGAAELRLKGVSEAGPAPAPDYPVPRDEGQVFFMQRSANPNTVVYSARFGADGALKSAEPLSAYWRRFNTEGQVKDLSTLERRLAYGVSATPRAEGGFDVDFRAVPQLEAVLEQRGPGQAVLSVAPEGEPIDLTYGYLQVKEGALAPRVTGLTLFGNRRSDGRPVQIEYGVSNG